MTSIKIRYPYLLAVFVLVAILLFTAFHLSHMDTDITRYLPGNDPVIADAQRVFRNHPLKDRLFMDIGLQKSDPALLVRCAGFVKKKLAESGLFRKIGFEDYEKVMPDLLSHVVNHLPVLFDERELRNKVAPLLTDDNIHLLVMDHYRKLLGLGGIGRSATMSKDPLALSNLVLARLSSLSPSGNVRFFGGELISLDGRHLLLMATPLGSGMDTAQARRLSALLGGIAKELADRFGNDENRVGFTPMGAYRSALDNEVIAREDSGRAILLASLGIALLLVFSFPRPLLGLFAFLPALFGSAAAFFVLSLWERSVSIMALGFGGAIVAITVDHGIAFLLFLDRPEKTRGKMAAKEIRSVGLATALTTMGAFGALTFSGFPIFEQLGLFTAMGIGFSFLFVHLVFPLIFKEMPPAPNRPLPLRRGVAALTRFGKKGALFMAILGFVMLFLARPGFYVSLDAMNTVSDETLAAQQRFSNAWGEGIFRNIFLMTEGKSIADLQTAGDRMLPLVHRDLLSGALAGGFIPAMVFPGVERARDNFSAWRSFWTSERIHGLKRKLGQASAEVGFSDRAFSPFLEMLEGYHDPATGTTIDPEFLEMMGITQESHGAPWVQFSNFKPGQAYDAQSFYDRYSHLGKIFDPAFFSEKLGALLFGTFLKMLWIIGSSVVVLLFLYFLDWRMVLAALMPVLFAMVCTLGTLHLLGRPLDIPGLMLSIVVIGMGIDYSLFMVRAYQRYGTQTHPSFGLVRMAVFMAGFSTIIGFGALCFSRHALLKSAGLTSLMGISYSLLGAFVLLPPVLEFILNRPFKKTEKPLTVFRGVRRRFCNMDAYPRSFVRFKMLMDPMFKELPRFCDADLNPKIILDIGTGYGIPACWLLERFPEAKVFGIEPDIERVRIASRAVGEEGQVTRGAAPQIPTVPAPADLAMMLDMTHYLSDEDFSLTLKRLFTNLDGGGRLLIRVVVPREGHHSLLWKLEKARLRLSDTPFYNRSLGKILKLINEAGFGIRENIPSGSTGESVWLMAEKG